MEVRPVCRHEPSATRPPRLSDWVGWSLLLLLWVAAPALAADANGSAYGARLGLSADVLGLGSATATLTETPQVAGVGPADYALADTVLGVQVGLLGTEVLNTGVLTVTTDHSAAVPTANSTSSVDDVSVNLQVTPLLQLLTLTADAVQAEAAITGVCGALQATGSTTLVNAQVRNLLGQTITLDTQPTANLCSPPWALPGSGCSSMSNPNPVMPSTARSVSMRSASRSTPAWRWPASAARSSSATPKRPAAARLAMVPI
ncbi:MAG: hypothetical protein R3F15_11615 [Lysobacterales bacterium]